jgi:uncharacterized protein involved in exopolysaccharide biosynthesis
MQVAAATYIEMKKNLEMLKMSINQETPLIQVIDSPTFPLAKDKRGKIKETIMGGAFGGFLALLFFMIQYECRVFPKKIKI